MLCLMFEFSLQLVACLSLNSKHQGTQKVLGQKVYIDSLELLHFSPCYLPSVCVLFPRICSISRL